MQLLFSLDDVPNVAKTIIEQSSFKVLCFYGQMGAGKTTLIKALVNELGGENQASSPTFGIVNEYQKKDGSLIGYHFDFYRVENETEALDLGFEDYLNQGGWIFIEWPEKIPSFLPDETSNIYLEVLNQETRSLEMR